MGWRKLVQRTRDPLANNLIAWRSAYEAKPGTIAHLPRIATEGAAVYSPLISLAVAGAVSGNAKFSNKASILDELIEPAGWNRGGMTYFDTNTVGARVRFPGGAWGSMCLLRGLNEGC